MILLEIVNSDFLLLAPFSLFFVVLLLFSYYTVRLD